MQLDWQAWPAWVLPHSHLVDVLVAASMAIGRGPQTAQQTAARGSKLMIWQVSCLLSLGCWMLIGLGCTRHAVCNLQVSSSVCAMQNHLRSEVQTGRSRCSARTSVAHVLSEHLHKRVAAMTGSQLSQITLLTCSTLSRHRVEVGVPFCVCSVDLLAGDGGWGTV